VKSGCEEGQASVIGFCTLIEGAEALQCQAAEDTLSYYKEPAWQFNHWIGCMVDSSHKKSRHHGQNFKAGDIQLLVGHNRDRSWSWMCTKFQFNGN